MVWLVAAAVLLAGTGAADQPTGLSISLERTACHGTCPVYRVTIDGEGRVVYKGSRFVRVDGTERTTIDPQDVRSLVQAFQRAGFWELKDEYTANVFDLPTTILTLTLDGRTKRVTDYYDPPVALKDLEARVDEIAGIKRWVYVDV